MGKGTTEVYVRKNNNNNSNRKKENGITKKIIIRGTIRIGKEGKKRRWKEGRVGLRRMIKREE